MTYFFATCESLFKVFLLKSFSLRISSKECPSAIKPFTDSASYYLVSLVTDYEFSTFMVLREEIYFI